MNNSIKGEKHICSNCGAKFFDLNKNPIICPKCNTEVVATQPNVRAKPLMSEPKTKDSNIDNSSTEDFNAIEGEGLLTDMQEDEIDDNEDDAATSTTVNID